MAACALAGGMVAVQGRQFGIDVSPGAGALIGGLLVFVVAAVSSAVFFLLVESAENTRENAKFFDLMSARARDREFSSPR